MYFLSSLSWKRTRTTLSFPASKKVLLFLEGTMTAGVVLQGSCVSYDAKEALPQLYQKANSIPSRGQCLHLRSFRPGRYHYGAGTSSGDHNHMECPNLAGPLQSTCSICKSSEAAGNVTAPQDDLCKGPLSIVAKCSCLRDLRTG
jgi:hypothetical protein